MTFQEFRTLAWQAANEKARDLGWVRSYDELHEAVNEPVRREQGPLANPSIKRVSPARVSSRIEPVLQSIANLEMGLMSSRICM